jgi:hypothetical protein
VRRAQQEIDMEQGRHAAERAQGHAGAAAEQAGLAAVAAGEVLSAVAGSAREVVGVRGKQAAEGLAAAYEAVRDRADNLPVPLLLEGVLEDARDRGYDVWEAVGGSRPKRASRYPWARGGAVAGALLGITAAMAVRRLLRGDAPGAQDPDQVQAVVDPAPFAPVPPPVPPTVPTASPTAAAAPVSSAPATTVLETPAVPVGSLDEDGEAVLPDRS